MGAPTWTPPRPPRRAAPVSVEPGTIIELDNRATARCAYCGRYGPLGACEGCGAPNRPAIGVRLEAYKAALAGGLLTRNEARARLEPDDPPADKDPGREIGLSFPRFPWGRR